MKNYLQSKEEDMFALLEKIVNIDSGTYVENGTNQVGLVLKEAYESEGFSVTVHDKGELGNHLQIQASDSDDPKILVVGHMDTVFPEGTVNERRFTRDKKKAYGPGVIDMKSSLVEVLYALKALKASGDPSYKNVQVFMNSDEEVGSPTSRQLIENAAKTKDYALVVEPSRGEKDYIVTQRKSVGRMTLKVKGFGSHAGSQPEHGISAILEMAHKTIKLEALNDYAAGISVNVGLVKGGTSVNTVSPSSECGIDIRVKTKEQGKQLIESIKKICSTPDIEGTTIELTGGISHPPMIKDEKVESLLKVVQEAGKEIGIEIEDTFTGGGSDGCFTSSIGTPTVDGMGPAGGRSHSEDEFLRIETFLERTLLLATTIKKLSS